MESEWLRTITHASVLSPTESKIWGKKVSVKRAWCTKSQSSLMKHLRILTSISVGSSPRSCSFASTAGLRPQYRSTAAKSGRNLSGMWRSTSKLGATHLRPMTEIALKSTYLCGNISPIRYDIRVGVRAIRMNIALDYSAVECLDWRRCVFQIKKKRFFSPWSHGSRVCKARAHSTRDGWANKKVRVLVVLRITIVTSIDNAKR